MARNTEKMAADTEKIAVATDLTAPDTEKIRPQIARYRAASLQFAKIDTSKLLPTGVSERRSS
jgi:hypothetical protein